MGATDILGVRLPDSRLARDVTQYVRDTEDGQASRNICIRKSVSCRRAPAWT